MNSKQRQSGTTDDFMISLKQPLTLVNSNNYFKVRLQQAVIPHNIKQINPLNSTLEYTFTRDTTNYNGSIVLTTGNYNILTLNDELKNKLFASIVALSSLLPDLTFTYDKTTGLDTFKISGSDGVPTSVNLKFGSNVALGKFFGFIDNAIFSYNDSNVSTTITSTQNVNVNQSNSIYVRSSTLAQRQSYENILEKDVYSDILAQIGITVLPGSFIFYDGNESPIDLYNNVIDSINIYLSDNNSYALSLNGLDWSCVLTFEEWGSTEPDKVLHEEVTTSLPDNTPDLMSQLDKLKSDLRDANA
jgi:hypothetical protein